MFDPCQKSTGISYTRTAALLILAFVLSPAVLAISRPFGQAALTVAITCSALCVVLAWLEWRNSSRLTIPSIETQYPQAKR
jgi:hypothetical protein